MSQAQDIRGASVRRGDIVRVLSIDSTLLATLPENERDLVASMLYSEAPIQDIGEDGFVIVERVWRTGSHKLFSQSLALTAREFELVRPLPTCVTDLDLNVVGCLLDDYESVHSLESGYYPPGPEAISKDLIKGALATAHKYSLANAHTYSQELGQYQLVTDFEISKIEDYWWKATPMGRQLFGLDDDK